MPEMDLVPCMDFIENCRSFDRNYFFLGCAAARWLLVIRGRPKASWTAFYPSWYYPNSAGVWFTIVVWKNGPLGKLLLKLGTTVIFSWWATVIAAVVVAFPLITGQRGGV